ncbi:hypothetical protein [Nocardiopsis gilva]|nr:hypothetical protein [Nocardiopsis gilva]
MGTLTRNTTPTRPRPPHRGAGISRAAALLWLTVLVLAVISLIVQ